MLSATRATGVEGHDHVRPKLPDHPDHVPQNLLAPALQGLLDAEGVTKLIGPCEVWTGAVETVHPQEFLGPEHSQGLEQFGTDLVLSAVAPGQAQKRGPDPEPPAHLGQDGVVFVVGMGRDVEK